MPFTTSDNNFGVSKWIVNPQPGLGTHTDIAAANASATSGQTIFIMPGTYSTGFAAKPNINYVGMVGDGQLGDVVFTSIISIPNPGTYSFSNIFFNNPIATNSLNINSPLGTVNVYLNSCVLDGNNSAGPAILFVGNAGSALTLQNCTMFVNQSTTIESLISTASSGGTVNCTLENCIFYNPINATNVGIQCANTLLNMQSCSCYASLKLTTSSISFISNCIVDTSLANTTSLDCSGSAVSNLLNSYFASGTAPTLEVDLGSVINASHIELKTGSANAVSGAGTFNYTSVAQPTSSGNLSASTVTQSRIDLGIIPTLTVSGSGSISGNATVTGNISTAGISFDAGTTTLNVFKQGTFSPTIQGSSTAGTGTYDFQVGYFQKVGNMCSFQATVSAESISGSPTGNAQIAGMPFTSKNTTNARCAFPLSTSYNHATTLTNAAPFASIINNVTAVGIFSYANGTGSNAAQAVSAGTQDFQIAGTYETV